MKERESELATDKERATKCKIESESETDGKTERAR